MVPGFQDIMLPLLRLVEKAGEIPLATKDAIPALTDLLGLTEEERGELLPSGRQTRFANRVNWASSYLRAAKLLESPTRGRLLITDRGRKLLSTQPLAINIGLLEQFREFIEFRNGTTSQDGAKASAIIDPETPEEAIEKSYKALRTEIVEEILNRLKACSPAFFEQIVVQLVVRLGYGGSLQDAGKAVGKSGDGGIDGVIKQDKLGLDVVYLQAKRWVNTVGRPDVQQFAGALAGQQANRGVFITTSDFSAEAVAYAKAVATKIVLINGKQLAEYMFDHDLGVTTTLTLSLKKIDSDFFEEE